MMRQKREEKIVLAYKIWTLVLIILFIFQSNSRWTIFSAWWITTAILMLYLLGNILYLLRLKKKLSEDKLQEIIQERNSRLARKAYKNRKRLEEEK